MHHTPQADTPLRTLAQFREWLTLEIGKSTDGGFIDIDFSRSVLELGMSSVHVVRLAGEFEKLLGIEVEPTLLYEYASLDALYDGLLAMREARLQRNRQFQPVLTPLVISATFTAEPIEDGLRHLGKQLQWPLDLRFARYNQVFQELLNPHSLIGQAQGGFAALLLRLEDWFRYKEGQPSQEAVDTMLSDFLAALAQAAGRTRASLLVVLAPHSPKSVRKLGLAERLDELDERLTQGCLGIPGVQVVDLRHVDRLYAQTRIWDDHRDELGHIPFTQACFTALAAGLMRHLLLDRLGAAKVIVLDCDNTLWGGVVGEDGVNGLRLDAPFLALQSFMKARQEAGQLLCLCSKNQEEDVWAVFDQRPDMRLTRQDIAAHRINWQRKSQNIAELAQALNLPLDAFVFVDDNPVEIHEVTASLPGVTGVLLPADLHSLPQFLAHHWAFDGEAVTQEDRARTQMIQAHQAREAARQQSAGLQDFLAQLGLVIELEEVTDATRPRAAQLTQRTNQFNAVKAVRSEAQWAQWQQGQGHRLLGVKVADRFGDYGLVGLLAMAPKAGVLEVEAFMLSCRVLGRGVEHEMIRAAGHRAKELGLDPIWLAFEPSDRNTVARTFLDSLGEGIVSVDGGRQGVALSAATLDTVLAHAVHQQEAPTAETQPAAPAEGGQAPDHAVPPRRSQLAQALQEIALIGPQLDAMQLRIQAESSSQRPQLPTEYATPRTAWEKKIAGIWRQVLRIDRVGIHDSFYALGGDSLRAAEAFARMWDLGVPESISLQTVENPTVASLCQTIETVLAGDRPTWLSDHFSLADEGQLSPDIVLPGHDVTGYDAPMRQVLVTGATGYVGAYLVHELVQQTDAEVICLVRAATPRDGLERVRTNLRRYGLATPATLARVSVVLGDLTEEHLGLGETAFRALAARIDTIVHSAAWVNFVYPYQHLKTTNVDSTEILLRLATAAASKAIQFHFISTMGVVMSTGYDRSTPILEESPLLHADDLLNGYEQSKYAADKMVWTAFKERGIPGNIYRPALVSGLSDGTYHKTDEFLPQCFKGCLQLGAWPDIDTPWEMAPVDFVSKAIVHIARQPRHLNRAYFVTHPRSQSFQDYLRWHQSQGFQLRALPWDVWKREFLNLGTERLRKNAMFHFVDFIRALSEEQVYFPPTSAAYFQEAIADLPFEVPDPMTLLSRYTRHFIRCGYYDEVPNVAQLPITLQARSGAVDTQAPSSQASAAPSLSPAGPVRPEGWLDEHIRFSPTRVDDTEAHYVLWNDPARELAMVVRYVLFNGPIDEARIAEVWCWFQDRRHPDRNIALRQRYPLGRAEILNTEAVRMQVGPSGYGADRVWGEVRQGSTVVKWDWTIDHRDAVPLARVNGIDQYAFFPHFQSNGMLHHIDGVVEVDGDRYELARQPASDGHYWNLDELKAWSWGHCSQFEGDPDFLFEGIAARLNDWTQPSTWLTFRHDGRLHTSNFADSFYFNRELDAGLDSWQFVAERGELRFVGQMSARTDEQILIVHPLPDDEYLYTHITYTGDMVVEVQRKEDGQWWTFETKRAHRTASFEVTRKVRNPEVKREFQIVRER